MCVQALEIPHWQYADVPENIAHQPNLMDAIATIIWLLCTQALPMNHDDTDNASLLCLVDIHLVI